LGGGGEHQQQRWNQEGKTQGEHGRMEPVMGERRSVIGADVES
jgi:hypothetical protein